MVSEEKKGKMCARVLSGLSLSVLAESGFVGRGRVGAREGVV